MAGAHTIFGGKRRVAVVNVEAVAYFTYVVDPNDATVEISFNSNGTVTILSDVGTPYSWLVEGVNSGLEIKFETVSGVLTTGTANTWLTMDTDQAISVVETAVGPAEIWTGVIRIRRASDMVELDSASVSLEAKVEASG